MKKIAVAALLTAMMGAASAQAYIGGVIGRSHVNIDCDDYNLGCDKSDTGTKLYAGYKFNPLIALEAAYVDFGKGSRGFTEGSDDVHHSFEASGALVAAAFRYAAHPQLSLVGRVGLSFLKTKFKQTTPNDFDTYSVSDDSVKPYIGVGIEFALNKNLRLTADADFTTAEVDNNKNSVRLLGVGLQYDF